MNKYVDGFILVIANDKLENYREVASGAGKIWMKHGALQYIECVGDDMHPDMGGMETVRFPAMAKANDNETVIFSFIVYKDRAHRDEVNAKVMADPAMNDPEITEKCKDFNMAKMAFGGFKTIVAYEI